MYAIRSYYDTYKNSTYAKTKIMKQLNEWLISFFENLDISSHWASAFGITISIIVLIAAALVAQLLVRIILVTLIHRIFQKTKTEWDDFLIKRKVFSALAHLPSAFMIYAVYDFSNVEEVSFVLSVVSRVYFVFIFTMAAVRFANTINDIYQTTPYAATRPIIV